MGERPKWGNTLGSALAFLSALFYTSQNFQTKYFEPNPSDLQFVRSVLTLLIVCLPLALSSSRRYTNLQGLNGKTITLILIQGILTAADIYLVNLSILFIPLGECYDLCAHTYNRDACNYDTFVTGVAMTIAFTNPIFALLFNAVIMKKCPGILKIFLVACLVAGVVLILQSRVVSSQTADGEHATSITKK